MVFTHEENAQELEGLRGLIWIIYGLVAPVDELFFFCFMRFDMGEPD